MPWSLVGDVEDVARAVREAVQRHRALAVADRVHEQVRQHLREAVRVDLELAVVLDPHLEAPPLELDALAREIGEA